MSSFSSPDFVAQGLSLDNLQYVQQIARLTPGVLLVMDIMESNIIFINNFGVKALGLTDKENDTQKQLIIKEWLYPDDYERLLIHLAACKKIADQEVQQLELRFKVKDTSWHWFCMNGVVLSRNDKGEVRHMLYVGYDIQIQKDAEKKAEEEQRRFNDAQALGHIGSFECKLPGERIAWSDEVYRIHGLAPQSLEITEDIVISFVHQDDQQILRESIEHLRTIGKRINLVTRIIRADGTIRHIHRRAEHIRDADGKPVRLFGILQDITEQVEAQTLSKAQKALLLEAEKVGKFGSYIIDFASWNIKFSDGMYRVLGHEPQAFIPSLELIDANSHPEDALYVRQVLEQSAITKKPYEYKRRIYLPDGQMRYMHSQGRVETNDKGEAIQFLGIVRDVTEQVIAEAQLKQKNELLEGVLNAPNVGITVFESVRNAEGEIVDFKYIMMSKLAKEHAAGNNLLGKKVHEVSSITSEQFKTLLKVVETGITAEHEVYQVQDNVERWYFNSCARFGDGVVMVWEDITKRKQAEAELRESIHFIRQVTDTTPDIMLVYDVEAHELVYLNRDIKALTGYSLAELNRMDQAALDHFIHPDDLAIVKCFHEGFITTKDNETKEAEFRLKSSLGAWRWFQIRGRVFKRDDGERVVQYMSIMRDITEQKKTYDELVEAEKLSVQGGMARTLAHEVRGPAANIGLSLVLLKSELSSRVSIPEETLVYFDIIEKSCNRITNYITELLQISTSKPEDFIEVDLQDLLEETLKIAQDRIYLQGVRVEKSFHKEATIHANRERLKIALLNIIINAIEAMHERKGLLQLGLEQDDLSCILTIQDNGSGMTAEQKRKMFDAYYTSKPNGLGVGLANVKTILQEHHADVTVNSEPGIGTEFRITFPRS